ncbi:MAG TPA: hypothetical protein VMJ93_11635 [Verrucomicrobiae bacterium]|nr:hypothetical protein [Verrucomicrobiae bacterium]
MACLAVVAPRANASGHSCRVVEKKFDGWQAVEMSNKWITLTIVPQLGGRLMQIEFAGHAFLFVNPQFKGKYFPPTLGAGQGKWFNYGGDKIWPMPEGNQDDHHWPGPIADALDDGEYFASILSQGHACGVRLDGPPDEKTGLQYSRVITIDGGSPEISFHAVMKNILAHPIQWSVQSVTQYDLSDSQTPSSYNHNFWAYTPANPNSVYLDGYHVRSGLADDPSFSIQNDLFTLHWLYLQNEVWVDSPGDWLVAVDRSSHFAMVERFRVHPGANYPGKATVIFYKNGPAVEMDAQGMPAIRANVDDTPFYMEAEINSPIVHLNPGETYSMDTEWLPTRAADSFQGVTPAGIIGVPLSVTSDGSKLRVTGSFGVFFPGRLEARILDSTGRRLANVSLGVARPEDLLTLNREFAAPADAARVQIALIDESERDRGILGEAAVVRNAGGH